MLMATYYITLEHSSLISSLLKLDNGCQLSTLSLNVTIITVLFQEIKNSAVDKSCRPLCLYSCVEVSQNLLQVVML